MNKAISFSQVTFLSSEASVVFNISSLYANANLSHRRFLHEQFLISKYPPILHVLLHSQLDYIYNDSIYNDLFDI